MRHYESGIRAVKPELLESISAALGVSVNALKDYGVETAGDLMSLLVRLEDSFGIVPAADGTGLSLNPKAPHAPKAAMAIELWAEKRAQLENGKIDADEYEDWKASL
ncbi:MAG TPA: XRE family transcriptional regulator [Candidatus Aveggerthella excrementigallinarum]|nr:XRE family transcriptional regulator [Candidatus Aveggerthella excrementigallinarum]